MTKLEKLHLFLRFWFSPWGAAKGVIWEDFSGDVPFSEGFATRVCEAVLAGNDDRYDWPLLERWAA